LIYVFGEPPQWLIDVVKELDEDIVRVNDCNVPPHSVIISVSNPCMAKGSVVISLLPYGETIPIQRGTARGILSTIINLVKRIGNTRSIDEALLLLGLAKTEVVSTIGMTEVIVKDRVIPGSIYTITVLNTGEGKCTVALGRGTARGTLILDSLITLLLSNGGDIYIAKGDLVLELMALSMIFNINLTHSNPPY
jgi:hypothetical protein